MAKTIESFGIPVVHIYSIVPISMAAGANRIIPAVGIPYPVENPGLPKEEELQVRRRIVKKALPVSSGIYVYLHCVEAGGTRLSRHMDLYAAYHWYYMSGPGPLL